MSEKEEDLVNYELVSDISLRDYFAGQALNGILSSHRFDYLANCVNSSNELAEMSYNLANAMMEERVAERNQ